VGRASQSNNVILDTTSDEGKWRELDLQVNEYPGQRTFKAIGTGDQDFVAAMTRCVEAVVGTVHAECINQRLSAKANYISVTIGPVWVENPDQVLQIYEVSQRGPAALPGCGQGRRGGLLSDKLASACAE
jgi:putative lipoic acid-binding regulatory protein